MPTTFLLGEAAVIEIETSTPGTYVQVGGLREFSLDPSNPDPQQFDIYMRATPLQILQSNAQAFAIAGLYSHDDPGQTRLNDLARAGTEALFRIKFDGTNGFSVLVKVQLPRVGSTAGKNPNTVAYVLRAQAAPTAVGTYSLPF